MFGCDWWIFNCIVIPTKWIYFSILLVYFPWQFTFTTVALHFATEWWQQWMHLCKSIFGLQWQSMADVTGCLRSPLPLTKSHTQGFLAISALQQLCPDCLWGRVLLPFMMAFLHTGSCENIVWLLQGLVLNFCAGCWQRKETVATFFKVRHFTAVHSSDCHHGRLSWEWLDGCVVLK